MIIAWDIETCPLPTVGMSDRQKHRHEKLVKRQLEKSPEMSEDEASLLVRSTNPFLGWICCLSVVRTGNEGNILAPKSYTAGLPSQEEELLSQFWTDVAKVKGRPLWVTFNGKRFDAPFLRTRTCANSLLVTRTDLLQTYPFRHAPHCDLFNIFEGAGLADVCDLLDVPSPKGDMDGSQVHIAVKNGELERVAAYCEGDVVATLQCYQKARHAIEQ